MPKSGAPKIPKFIRGMISKKYVQLTFAMIKSCKRCND
jgi:hypothetical protein